MDEGKALNTIENIRNVRAMVGDGRVALVTSAYHMPRALQIARAGQAQCRRLPDGLAADADGPAAVGQLDAVGRRARPGRAWRCKEHHRPEYSIFRRASLMP